MIDAVLNILNPYLAEIVGFVAGALATGLVWLTKRTKNTLDDKILRETAEDITDKTK